MKLNHRKLFAALLAAVLLCTSVLSAPVFAQDAVMKQAVAELGTPESKPAAAPATDENAAPTAKQETVASGDGATDANASAAAQDKPADTLDETAPALPAAPATNNTARIELPSFEVPCRNAILVAADTGDVLYEKEPDAQVPIASITKVMTLLLTLEAVEAGKITLQDIVPISEHAFNMGGSQIWLEPGEQFTLDELIKAICVSSANDAAVAVAEYVGGTEPVFAEMMNARAKELGMTNTHFVNACGLDIEGHYSSARDVAMMSAALLHHPLILEYSGIWMDTLRGGATQLTNTNKLLKKYPGITGLKTGTTSKAGVCISATASREGLNLIAVVLGSDSGQLRFESATQLLDYGFATYEYTAFPMLENAPETLAVSHGAQQEMPLIYGTPAGILCRKGEGKELRAVSTLPATLEAPVSEGSEVGSVLLLLGETALAQYPVLAADEAEKLGFSNALSLLMKALLTL